MYLYACRHAHSFHTYRYRYLTSYVAVYPAAQALYTINLNREHISKTKCLNSTKFSTHNQQVCVHLATYACPPPHAAAAAIDRYVLPTGPTAANPPHAIYCRGRMRHTDGRTDTVPFHRPSPYYASSANNGDEHLYHLTLAVGPIVGLTMKSYKLRCYCVYD